MQYRKLLNAFFCIIVVGFSGLLQGCDQSADDTSAKEFSKVMDSARRVLNTRGHVPALHIIDSAVARHKTISVADRFDVYMLHCDYYANVKIDYNKAALYADSMLNLIETSGHPKDFGKQLGIAYFSLGDVAFHRQKYIEAYQYYYKGKEIGK
jgi:hypothetical protein